MAFPLITLVAYYDSKVWECRITSTELGNNMVGLYYVGNDGVYQGNIKSDKLVLTRDCPVIERFSCLGKDVAENAAYK